MVSDEDIIAGVQALLRQAPNFSDVTFAGIVQQLESKLGSNLSGKLPFIHQQIDLLLRSTPIKPHPFYPQQHQQNHATLIAPAFHHHYEELQIPYETKPTAAPHFECSPKSHVFAQNSEETPKDSTPSRVKRRGGPGGLTKVCGVSPELQAIVGQPTMPRTQIVKELWAYIRKNNIQDPTNKRKIICDEALRLVFETDVTDMFKMNKLLAKHILPLTPTKDLGPDPKRVKVEDSEVSATNYTEAGVSSSSSSKPLSHLSGVGFYAEAGVSPVIISDRLAKFFGTAENEMLPSVAAKCVWDYVKVNQLEDPLNSMEILCDAKLQELFDCESFSAVGISEMLSHHFLKR